MSGPAQKTVTTLDVITGPDTTGPVGAIRLSRSASGLQASVDGAAPAPIVGTGGFGSDTTVPLANAAAADVQALRITVTLPTNTAGAEISNLIFTLLAAGVARGVLTLDPNTSKFTSANTDPNVRQLEIESTDVSGQAGISLVVGGTERGGIRGDSGGNMTVFAAAGQIGFYNGGDAANGGSQRVLVQPNGTMVMGKPGAMATSATGGFIMIPTMAGAPIGTPDMTNASGMGPMVLDTSTPKIWFWTGAAWKGVTIA